MSGANIPTHEELLLPILTTLKHARRRSTVELAAILSTEVPCFEIDLRMAISDLRAAGLIQVTRRRTQILEYAYVRITHEGLVFLRECPPGTSPSVLRAKIDACAERHGSKTARGPQCAAPFNRSNSDSHSGQDTRETIFAYGSEPVRRSPPLDPATLKATVNLTKAAIDDGIVTFADFVAYVADSVGGAHNALKVASYLELVWDRLGKRSDFAGKIDAAGSAQEILEKRAGGMDAGDPIANKSETTATEKQDERQPTARSEQGREPERVVSPSTLGVEDLQGAPPQLGEEALGGRETILRDTGGEQRSGGVRGGGDVADGSERGGTTARSHTKGGVTARRSGGKWEETQEGKRDGAPDERPAPGRRKLGGWVGEKFHQGLIPSRWTVALVLLIAAVGYTITSRSLDTHSDPQGKGIRRVPVSSSALLSVGYDEFQKTLEIEFHNGAVYRYYDVPPDVHRGLMAADSHGRFFHRRIRGAGYRYSRVD